MATYLGDRPLPVTAGDRAVQTTVPGDCRRWVG